MSPQSLKCLLSILQTVPVNSQFIDYVVPKMLWPIRSVTPHLSQSHSQMMEKKPFFKGLTNRWVFESLDFTIFAAEIPTAQEQVGGLYGSPRKTCPEDVESQSSTIQLSFFWGGSHEGNSLPSLGDGVQMIVSYREAI